jgi:hypothetical protein
MPKFPDRHNPGYQPHASAHFVFWETPPFANLCPIVRSPDRLEVRSKDKAALQGR